MGGEEGSITRRSNFNMTGKTLPSTGYQYRYIKNKILGGNICKQKEIESLDSVTVLKEDTQLEPPIVSHCPSIKYFASLHKLVILVESDS